MNTPERQEWTTTYKMGMGCADCGESFAPALSFHHLDPATKKANIAIMVAQACEYTDSEFFAEIAKCVVVCENCHRKRRWYAQARERPVGYPMQDGKEEAAGLLQEEEVVSFREVEQRALLRVTLSELQAEWDTLGERGRPQERCPNISLLEAVEMQYPGKDAPREEKLTYKAAKARVYLLRQRYSKG